MAQGATLKFSSAVRGGPSCEVRSPLGYRLTVSGSTNDIQPKVVDGDSSMTGNLALVENAWAFTLHKEFGRLAPTPEEQKSHRKQAEVHKEVVENIAPLLDSLGDEVLSDWCSGCFTYSDHVKVEQEGLKLPTYICETCGTPTIPCVAPGCAYMAVRGSGSIRLPSYCAEHSHKIPSFERAADKVARLEDYATLYEYDERNLARATRVVAVAGIYAALALAFAVTARATPSVLLLFAIFGPGFGFAGLRVQAFISPCVVESDYYCIRVDDFSSSTRRPSAIMVLDHLAHGINDRDEPRLLFSSYLQFLDEYMHERLSGQPPAALVIGGGALTLPRAWARDFPEAKILVAEIDPLVTRTAATMMWAAPTPAIQMIHGDGRMTLQSLPEAPRFDVVFADGIPVLKVHAHIEGVPWRDVQIGDVGRVREGVFANVDAFARLHQLEVLVGGSSIDVEGPDGSAFDQFKADFQVFDWRPRERGSHHAVRCVVNGAAEHVPLFVVSTPGKDDLSFRAVVRECR